jgi:hypothetical protein
MRLLSAPKLSGNNSGQALDLGAAPPAEGQVERLTHPQATEILDWLERKGVTTRDLQVADDGSFTVTWTV